MSILSTVTITNPRVEDALSLYFGSVQDAYDRIFPSLSNCGSSDWPTVLAADFRGKTVSGTAEHLIDRKTGLFAWAVALVDSESSKEHTETLVKSVTGVVEALEKENARLEAHAESNRTTLEILESQYATMKAGFESQIRNLTGDLEARAIDHARGMENLRAEHNNAMGVQKGVEKALQDKIATLEMQMENMNLTADEGATLAMLNDARAEAQTARAELATARAELETARAELETARTEADAARAELATAETELETARAEADAAETELETELETAETELATARAELETARAELETARTEADAARTEIQTLGMALEAARGQANTLGVALEAARAESLDTADANISALRAELEEERKKARALEQQRAEAATRSEELAARLAKARTEIKELTSGLQETEKRAGDFAEAAQDALRQAEDARAKHNAETLSLKEEITRLGTASQATNVNRNQEAVAHKREVTDLQTKIDRLGEEMKVMQVRHNTKVNGLQESVDKLSAELDAKRVVVLRWEQDLATANAALSERQATIMGLERDIEGLMSENARQGEEVECLQRAIAELASDNTRLLPSYDPSEDGGDVEPKNEGVEGAVVASASPVAKAAPPPSTVPTSLAQNVRNLVVAADATRLEGNKCDVEGVQARIDRNPVARDLTDILIHEITAVFPDSTPTDEQMRKGTTSSAKLFHGRDDGAHRNRIAALKRGAVKMTYTENGNKKPIMVVVYDILSYFILENNATDDELKAILDWVQENLGK
jgi:chromosome segregation ATPase